MSDYALIKTSTGAILRRHFFDGSPPILRAAKDKRWILDNPPEIDSRYQRIVEVLPVPPDAAEVPYTVQERNITNHKKARRQELKEIVREKQPDYLMANDLVTLRTEAIAKRDAINNAANNLVVADVDLTSGWTY